jgi:uncharacterized RDD family membrane protein YckC
MQCRYCHSWNSEQDHRCSRCGRRLVAGSRPAQGAYPIQTATAPALAEYSRTVVEEAPEAPAEPKTSRVVYQRSLFREMQQVVPIPVLRGSDSRETMKPPRPSRTRAGRKVHADQQSLDFATPRVRTALEAVIYCDAPVASPVHRTMAVAMDSSMILMAVGLFMVTFHFMGPFLGVNVGTSGGTIPLLAGVAAAFGFLYYGLFALANGDTPGMIWAQLELMNFDGHKPDRRQRAQRLFAKCLSVLAAGLGLLWALVDEESLTWHDHISRTFPTPRE